MNKYFVDTNLFLRYLTNDIPEQANLLYKLMESAKKGKVRLITHSLVIAEIVLTLGSFYKYPKKKIDIIIEVRKLGELIPIIPKIGQRGATIIKRKQVALSFSPKCMYVVILNQPIKIIKKGTTYDEISKKLPIAIE